jgi:anti-anti-sigma factor
MNGNSRVLPRQHEADFAWTGDVTWHVTADLRDALFDQLEAPGRPGVRLDVRGVSSIDKTGVALLIGANHRAAARGRRLELVDTDGPVTRALAAMHLLRDFVVTQLIGAGDPGTSWK